MNAADPVAAEAFARAIGDELRRRREALGLSREAFVRKLSSRVSDRTLHAYEHGLRLLQVVRLVELCEGLKDSPPDVLACALQRAELHLSHLKLRIDLNKVLQDQNLAFRPMHQWARNRLNHTPNGVIAIPPDAIQELAAFVGQTTEDLTRYLCKFTPDPPPRDIAA